MPRSKIALPLLHVPVRQGSIKVFLLVFLMTAALTSRAQNSASAARTSGCQSLAVARVNGEVDDSERAMLSGNLHRFAQAQYDQGRADDNLLMEHMIMMLKRTPEQEQALTARIDKMHNTRSALYHQWLRAEDVGNCYGVAESDITAVTEWLQKHGFQVDSVPAGKMLIMFTGTAGNVREAFQTEIHNLKVNGENHIANMSEPTIPKALAPVIAGFRSLHNFFPKPLSHIVGPVKRDPKTGMWQAQNEKSQPNVSKLAGHHPSKPLITYSGGFWAVAPQDLYTIYNETPLLTASAPINGAGQTLAIVQDTDIDPADVTSFRSQFGLPAYPSTPNAIQGGVNYMGGISGYCSDPGIVVPESEADIDVEWIGTTAPAATIDLVSCADTSTTFGGDLSAPYIVNNLDSTVSAFSLSFGWCEANIGSIGLSHPSFYNTLWQQAVAEGQTPVVSAGDTGDNTCDRGNGMGPNGQDLSVSGLSVNGMGSSPYNISADGTDFSDFYQNNLATYWNSNDTSPYGSALSYIPETAWDNSCTNVMFIDYISWAFSVTYSNGAEGLCNNPNNYFWTMLDGGSGGASTLFSLPTWQSAYGVGLSSNYTSTSYRNLPDISLFASDGGDWYHLLTFCESDTGYPCNYANTTDFEAMAAGGTSFVAPMVAGIIGLVNQAWPSGNPEQATRQGQADYTLYALATTEYGTTSTQNISTSAPSTYTCEGSNINAISAHSSVFSSCVFHEINRTSQYGKTSCLDGTSTGCLVVSNDEPCMTGSVSCYTNTIGDAYGQLSISSSTFEPAFPQSAGYNDATGLGSVNIANLVNNWTKVSTPFASTTTASATPSTLPNNSATTTLTATVTATGRGGIAPPLGDVTFYAGSSCSGTAIGSANLVPATGCTTSCNSVATLANVTGSQVKEGTVRACFSGDGANDAASTSSPVSIIVGTPTTTTETVAGTPSSSQINAGAAVTLSATVAPSSGSTVPTGTVTFTNGSTTLGSGTLNSSGIATYNTSSLATGSYSVVATYGGDTNYAVSVSSESTFSVVDFTVAASPATVTVSAPGQSGQTTLTIKPISGFNETLSYSCSGLPSESTCSFTSASATTETVSIQTTAPSTSRLENLMRRNRGWFFALLLPGFIGLVSLVNVRKRNSLTLCALLMLLMIWLPACGGSSNSKTTTTAGTPTGSSTVTVTATTGSGSGALSHTVQLTLTVQ